MKRHVSFVDLLKLRLSLWFSIIVLLFGVFQTTTAYAISQNDLNSIYYNTPYYDPTAAACAGGQTVLTGNDPTQKAYNYFISKGLNAVAAAAVVGNLSEESAGLNPIIIQNPPGGTTTDPSWITASNNNNKQLNPQGVNLDKVGWGIAQWTPGAKVLDEAKRLNITSPISDLATQLDIVWGEMTTVSPAGAKDMVVGLTQTTQNPPTDPAKLIAYIDAATEYFRANFESGDKSPARQTAAEAVYANYHSTTLSAASACGVQCNTGSGTTSENLSGIRQTVVCLAEQELAAWQTNADAYVKTPQPWMQYTKYSAGSIGLGWSTEDANGNRTRDGDGLTYHPGDVYDGYQWCAAFVSWIYMTADDSFTGGYQGIPWRFSTVQQIYDYGQKPGSGFIYHDLSKKPYTPRPGDIIIFGDLVAGFHHTAIVKDVIGDKITEIGGDQDAVHNYFGGPLNTAMVTSWSPFDPTNPKNGVAGFVSPDN